MPLDFYRPLSFADIVGQPQVSHLARLAKAPQASCWLLEGEPGTGKTISAHVFAESVGCFEEFTGKWQVPCAELGIEDAKELFRRTLRLRFGSRSGYNVLILEELEWLSQQTQRFLKYALDRENLPRNVVVVATSNGAQKLDKALIERFRVLAFSNGPHFRDACRERLTRIWSCEAGEDDMPPGWMSWGRTNSGFSMRVALASLQCALAAHERQKESVA